MSEPDCSDGDYSREDILEMEVALTVMASFLGNTSRELIEARRAGDQDRIALLIAKRHKARALQTSLYAGNRKARERCIAEYAPLVRLPGRDA
ncbi:hypothetical protein [Rhodomicrobium lacus]|uniref:hypothetical protein n=1 Tax=Rhodomicrobium lacus TaxID=2498452 RepID=UPI000F8C8844|nr:hypothetical protein [Rhodomicrobium lacus]